MDIAAVFFVLALAFVPDFAFAFGFDFGFTLVLLFDLVAGIFYSLTIQYDILTAIIFGISCRGV